MRDAAPNLRLLVHTLHEAGVRYVVVGGFAAIIHGSDRTTTDIDLAFAPEPGNVEALVEALRPLRPYLPRSGGFRDEHWDAKSIGGSWVRLRTDAGVIDLMRQLQGVESFAGLHERAVTVELYGVEVQVASVEDLIRMKEGSPRGKDAYDIDTLRALQEQDG